MIYKQTELANIRKTINTMSCPEAIEYILSEHDIAEDKLTDRLDVKDGCVITSKPNMIQLMLNLGRLLCK